MIAATSDPDVPLGMRRVEWIRLVVGDGPTRAEAVGVGYRLPVTIPIPMSTALRLVGRGTPFLLAHGHANHSTPTSVR